MARFLVTGGAGFIGSHIVEQLLNEGHFVRVLDSFYAGKEENLAFINEDQRLRFELIRADIRDTKICEQAMEGIDYVSHQAALRSVPESLVNPEAYNDVNIHGTLCLLKAAVKNKIKRFVLASSAAVYGNSTEAVQYEGQYPLLMSPYALSKLTGEYYCRIYSEHFGLETICLRYFNAFGPRQALNDEYAGVIPKFIHSFIKKDVPTIFGTGLQSRDFIYVGNIAKANILAALQLGLKHEVYNTATGKETTILDLVAVLNKITGQDIKPLFESARVGDILKSCGNIQKIQSQLKFEPSISFEEGMRHALQWYQQSS